MKTIIVDDEPKAIALLESYLRHFPELELVGSFRNGLKALSFLNTRPVDLIFLDINMPHISGMALARILDERTRVIFTTAYSEYAVESYELTAVDYLLKPITLERFAKAIRKVIQPAPAAAERHSLAKPQTIMVKSGSKTYQLDPARIYYLEKDHNYMLYHLEEEKILARQSAAEALETLPENFLQIHKSYIVNRDHIQYFDRHEISVKGRTLSLGLSFRERFLATMQA
ncbi:LytR/AlgR family response regulator transcription factor [Flavilitoribacter nigricans]|uniref:DNA-binding response regulator n=1 Tax=Flavilitoribacter nigricans (strain ATCC 23147 / DSM 23189 / NBRC 102662 / NCIMB 1420 / SS-2) TaxID=1122177 RepID=A0A2D0NI51_FLAN2|nr:LytTR family DNA-binding domain-containing protein [Flavilitoribacter nigricans]PHN08192.1 DNA-binding response regulator [Flavilitoribacter nigricans DSM 23189 = NBRC 102662]